MMDLRFPIGAFEVVGDITSEQRSNWIEDIARMPEELRATVSGLSDAQLDTPYRPGGWTVRQVVHHLADSHMNSLVRFKLALTEEQPTIKPYNEAAWAELLDSRTAPIALSLQLLDALHGRWALLLRSLPEEAFSREFFHPDSGVIALNRSVGNYAWHGKHHIAHITSLRLRMGW